MPRRTSFEISSVPYQYKNRSLRMEKSYTATNFKSSTVLTDDVFTYIEFYFTSHKKAMKYRNPTSKARYGSESKYHYLFYWKQAMTFYQAAKALPIASVPLLSYYAMLNAAKSFLAFRCEYIEDFVEDFGNHGLFENVDLPGVDLANIAVGRKNRGVFPLFGKTLEKDFDAVWPGGKSHAITLKKLLYNLAYIHRAYTTTYSTPRGASIPELFLPLTAGRSPCYHKANDGNLYLLCELDRRFFSTTAASIPAVYTSTLPAEFRVCESNSFALRSVSGAKRNTDSLSAEFKSLNHELRRSFQYIRSGKRLWYIKRTALADSNVLNLNSMLITMAAMHRISEIVRYKPEQLAHLMNSKENWLIHEFISLALDQFIDEIAAEITGHDIMGTSIKF